MIPVKPTIFLSHASEDADIALELKEWFRKKLLNGVELFVSSDDSCVKGGEKWLDKIKEALSAAKLVILLCSPAAKVRFWVTFEAGGAYFLGKDLAPLCVRGTAVEGLPQPYPQMQGYLAEDPDDLRRLLARLAESAGLQVPRVTQTELRRMAKRLGPVPPRTTLWVDDAPDPDRGLIEVIQRNGAKLRISSSAAILGRRNNDETNQVVMRCRRHEAFPKAFIVKLRRRFPSARLIIYADRAWLARSKEEAEHLGVALVTAEEHVIIKALEGPPAGMA